MHPSEALPALGRLSSVSLPAQQGTKRSRHQADSRTQAPEFRNRKKETGAYQPTYGLDWWIRSADDLAEWQARNPKGGSPVFLSAHAGHIRRQSAANVARRLKTAIKRANVELDKLGIEPISERVTPHSLRRTCISLRAALRNDPVYISEQVGHTDPRFTLSVYAKAVKRRVKLSGAYLARFDQALAWAALPTTDWAATGSESPPTVHREPAALEG
jgi:integrase